MKEMKILEIFSKVYTCIIVEHKMNYFKLKTLNKSKEHIINHICLYLICRLVIIYSINTYLGNNFPQFINISNTKCTTYNHLSTYKITCIRFSMLCIMCYHFIHLIHIKLLFYI